MTEPLEFTSAVRRDEPISFTLDGVEYGFRPPKEAIYVLTNRYDWLDTGLLAHDRATALETAASIEDETERAEKLAEIKADGWRGPTTGEFDRRLRDPDDPLDIPTLDAIIDGLRAQVAGRPTM
jgi:hypothetical protein